MQIDDFYKNNTYTSSSVEIQLKNKISLIQLNRLSTKL